MKTLVAILITLITILVAALASRPTPLPETNHLEEAAYTGRLWPY